MKIKNIMEEKQKILSTVFEKLIPHWEKAAGFLVWVQSDTVDEKTIDELLGTTIKFMNNRQKEKKDQSFHEALKLVQKIKHSESKETETDDIDNLLQQS